jgi:uncharacterized protein (TIGR02444 family)
MHSDLNGFTLDFYARAGVEQACLQLQSRGANVCAVLCGVWLGLRGVPCNEQRALEIRQLAAPWDAQVVQPLRELRTQWKNAAMTDQQLAVLRKGVKKLEVEAELVLLSRLEALTHSWSEQGVQDTHAWLLALAAGDAAHEHPDALQTLQRVSKELA